MCTFAHGYLCFVSPTLLSDSIEIFPDLIGSFSHLIEIISRKNPFTSRFVNELSNFISDSSDKRPSKWF